MHCTPAVAEGLLSSDKKKIKRLINEVPFSAPHFSVMVKKRFITSLTIGTQTGPITKHLIIHERWSIWL